jgi:hypothetical protein
MKKDFCITVLFGSDQVRKFQNKEIFSEEEIAHYTKNYEFETDKELCAFILGLEAANGWIDLIYLKNINLNKNRFITELG